MANEFLAGAALLWAISAIIALAGPIRVARYVVALGCLSGVAAALAALPAGTSDVPLPTEIAGLRVHFVMAPDGLWLMGFGLTPALFAALTGTTRPEAERGWLFGFAISLIGALGVFGLQDGASLIIAWETMSFGGAVMLSSERLSRHSGQSVMFMLALLEVGTVAMLLAVIILGSSFGSLDFAVFAGAATKMGSFEYALVGVFLIVAFGAKLGLLPFYEWFPNAYGSGSGATGAVMSGIVLNAAFFALGRAMTDWMGGASVSLGALLVMIAVVSAVLTALYAFQSDDWRNLLSFSSADNASIAVVTLGTSMLFRADGQLTLAGLAWTVSLLHLAGHTLAKGGLFLAADGVYRGTGSYAIRHNDILRRTAWPFGLGALLATASLAAMPPMAGFVSEWYVFQTVFQGFHLASLGPRLILAIAGAGLALTVAIAFATFVKVFGIGLLGRRTGRPGGVPASATAAVAFLGTATLGLAVGMPYWLGALKEAVFARTGGDMVAKMVVGWDLVPATGGPISPDTTFAFISPSKLAIAMPLLALLPIILLLINRRSAVRREPVWYGGFTQDPARASTTALTFSNAMRTFYGFVYRPTVVTEQETNGQPYFIRRLVFTHAVAPLFGPLIFRPAVNTVQIVANRLRRIQSGHLNFYLALIGALLVIILAISLI